MIKLHQLDFRNHCRRFICTLIPLQIPVNTFVYPLPMFDLFRLPDDLLAIVKIGRQQIPIWYQTSNQCNEWIYSGIEAIGNVAEASQSWVRCLANRIQVAEVSSHEHEGRKCQSFNKIF